MILKRDKTSDLDEFCKILNFSEPIYWKKPDKRYFKYQGLLSL